MKLYFITSNFHKFTEASMKFNEIDIEIDQLKISYPEIQADSNDEIIKYGIEWILEKHIEKIDSPFIIEDAGLFVHSLNNFPGVYSKFVYHTIGPAGILGLLSDKISDNDRTAHFEACLGYFDPFNKKEDNTIILKGICTGTISREIRGTNGFGYDPIFIPEGLESTFGEISTEIKNQYSHRSQVLDKLVEFLTE